MSSPQTDLTGLLGDDAAQHPGATEAQIDAVERRLGVKLPDDLRRFLRWSNGWEGTFRASWLVVWSTDLINELGQGEIEGLVSIGGDGGLECYTLDYRTGSFSGVVSFDENSSDPADMWPIATGFTEALLRLGDQPAGPW